MIAEKFKKATAATLTLITNTVKDTIAGGIQLGYTSAKEGKALIFRLKEEYFIHTVQQCLLCTRLVLNVDILAELKRSMDAIAQQLLLENTFMG